jgi:Glycosyltransferase 61
VQDSATMDYEAASLALTVAILLQNTAHTVCKLINNQLSSKNQSSRAAIALYEELEESKDFSIIPIPSPTGVFKHYPPKVSVRDCNREDLLRKKLGQMSWIVWGNQPEVLTAEEQRRHCLSTVPIRHIPEFQPLFVAYAEDAHINQNGVVRTANEDLRWKRTCWGDTKLKDYLKENKTCECEKEMEIVLVASQYWGNEVGHFTGETLPRIVSYLDLARKMPVHLWGDDTGQIRNWLRYLNVTAIRGDNICAKKVYVASPSDCRGGAYMSNMMLKTREILNPPHANDKPSKVLIMNRDEGVGGFRREPVRSVTALVTALHNAGYANIEVIMSSNSTFWSCIPCQLETYRNTKLFISAHGAGTMNLQFMPEGTYVVEIASINRPEEPFYSNLAQRAYLLGQRFYHYYWQNKTYDDSTCLDIDFFVSELMEFAPPQQFLGK